MPRWRQEKFWWKSRRRLRRMTEDLLIELKEHTAFLIINRESRRNAISREMIAAFLAYLDRLDQDPEVRAVCITAKGDKTFCSGADLASTLAGEKENHLAGPRSYAALLKKMAGFGKPLIARVNGACIAGGLGLMLSCDLAIARSDAYIFTPEVNVGIFPMMVGALLYRHVGRKKAIEMVLTGRRIPAPEAERIGLITRAVEPDRLDREVRETLQILTAKSPVGIRIGKEAFRVMSDMAFDEAVDYLCEALGKVISTEDAAEGMAAFMEKREPRFRGR
jgi:enoyl-CoA hydratase/carnithine racemase